ncbi:hypothetical protein ABMA28_011180 [Loxostege sticticalis]|uniref:Androgen-dependent TFPI-regulating protein n=1 Tax=Loxostege sticticalis TaxID=481309 RepID=A0ABD0S705_LOXSC
MEQYVYPRIVGHVLTAYLQISYFLEMQRKLADALPTHPELQEFAALHTRYLTMWNLLFQVVYACGALICDVTTALKMEAVVPTWFRRHRFTFFNGIVVPFMMGVSIFWPVFLYDRSLILPKHLDVAISPTCNFLWHGAIIIYSFWETMFLPRDTAKNTTVKILVAAIVAYIATLLYTRYVDLGIWPYGFMAQLEGTVFLYISLAFAVSFMILTYFIQFYVRNFIWQMRKEIKIADRLEKVMKDK